MWPPSVLILIQLICNIHFFTNRELTSRLYALPIHLVGSRMTKMLLSRFVVLDSTACDFFIPDLLTPCLGTSEYHQMYHVILGSAQYVASMCGISGLWFQMSPIEIHTLE